MTGGDLAPSLPGPTGNALHVVTYAVLGALLLRFFHPASGSLWRPESWPGMGTPVGRRVVCWVLLAGLVDEAHQFFVPGRACSVLDIGLDGLGAFLVLTWPLRGAPGRGSRWTPFGAGLVAAGVLAWVGWRWRPFPDQALEWTLGQILRLWE